MIGRILLIRLGHLGNGTISAQQGKLILGRRRVRRMSKKSAVIPGRDNTLEAMWSAPHFFPHKNPKEPRHHFPFRLTFTSLHLFLIRMLETFQGHGSLFTQQEQVKDKKGSERDSRKAIDAT